MKKKLIGVGSIFDGNLVSRHLGVNMNTCYLLPDFQGLLLEKERSDFGFDCHRSHGDL